METYRSGVEQQSAVRVGDAERDECMATLTEHHVRGRLSVDELDRRHRAALVAVTEADLDALVTDLPAGASPRHVVTVGDDWWSRVAGDDWWSLEPRERAKRWARWAATPMSLTAGGALVVAYNSPYDETAFAGGVAAAALGYVTHWVVAKWRPGKAD